MKKTLFFIALSCATLGFVKANTTAIAKANYQVINNTVEALQKEDKIAKVTILYMDAITCKLEYSFTTTDGTKVSGTITASDCNTAAATLTKIAKALE